MPPPFPIGDGAHQAEVRSGKRVRLAQLAQRDVLCSPFTDTVNRTQSPDRIVKPAICFEQLMVGDRGGGNRRQRRRAAARHPETR